MRPNNNDLDQRIARAAVLAHDHPAARELLTFYQVVANFQISFQQHLQASRHIAPFASARIVEELNVSDLLPKFPAFLQVVQSKAPNELAESARSCEAEGRESWADALGKCWSDSAADAFTPGHRFLAHAFLQPVAELLADRSDVDTGPNYAKPVCPFCGRKAVAGVLRPEGDGGKRSLVCCFCALEWQFRRVLCPACGETDLGKLPVYLADDLPQVRVECCDTCRTFIKTIDLTTDGRANPIVDEIATVALTLWANENGYTKSQPNVFGM